MSNHDKKARANSLQQKALRFAEGLWKLKNSNRDVSTRKNRVFLTQTRLPGFSGQVFDGGARFDKHGNVKAIGLRQNTPEAIEEFVVRTTRSRITIIHRIQPRASREMVVREACYSNSNRLLRFREELQPASLTA